MIFNTICIIILALLLLDGFISLFNKTIYPKIIAKNMKEIEKNPKWIMSKANYYGFQDIDIILTENKYGGLPCFRINKDERFQLLISNDTLTQDVDEVVKLALLGKILVRYRVWFPEKPTYWLSTLCYMLDGGDVQLTSVELKEKE